MCKTHVRKTLTSQEGSTQEPCFLSHQKSGFHHRFTLITLIRTQAGQEINAPWKKEHPVLLT
jgi:hypothetical protein